jgi:hypothetical protein
VAGWSASAPQCAASRECAAVAVVASGGVLVVVAVVAAIVMLMTSRVSGSHSAGAVVAVGIIAEAE